MPRAANTLVVVNLEQMLQSPQGIREGWSKKVEEAFEAGVTRVPPDPAVRPWRRLDLESAQPVWEAAVLDLKTNVAMDVIASKRSGKADKIGDLAALALPNDVYAVQFGPRTLGALAPANRQAAPAGSGNQALIEGRLVAVPGEGGGLLGHCRDRHVMAVDLAGAFSLERTSQYVEKAEALRSYPRDWDKVAKLLAGVEGLRLGIRITQKPVARVTFDFGEDASVLARSPSRS